MHAHVVARLAALLPTLAVSLALAPQALAAGTFTQFTCKLPDGTPAATEGWVAEPDAALYQLADRCDEGGSLEVEMNGESVFAGTNHGWGWRNTGGTSLQRVTLNRAYAVAPDGSAARRMWRVESGTTTAEESWSSPTAGSLDSWNHDQNFVTFPASSLSDGIRVAVGCYGTDGAVCPSGSASYARIHSATFTLADEIAPTVSEPSGSLTTSDVKSGTESIVFGATDAGGGVYRAIVSVDGQVIGAPVLDSSGGTCADAFTALGDSDPYQFESRTPCPATVSGAQLPLDTTRFADGDHRVAVVVEDAAGNRTPVYGPATMTIRNASTPGGSTTPPSSGGAATSQTGTTVGAGTPNGLNATPNAQLDMLSVARTVRLRYGRAKTLRGRLTTPAGTGIAGAAIDVTARTSLPGAVWRTAGTVRTDASGSFSYRIPVGASRTVRFAYRVATGDAQPVESDDVVVRVISRVDLSLSRSRVRNGQTLRYRGRIRGPYAKGRLAEIQVRVQRRWRVVCVIRARAHGRFRCGYRFRRTFVPTRYAFRAVVRRQNGFPYELGTSPTRRVRVSPR